MGIHTVTVIRYTAITTYHSYPNACCLSNSWASCWSI